MGYSPWGSTNYTNPALQNHRPAVWGGPMAVGCCARGSRWRQCHRSGVNSTAEASMQLQRHQCHRMRQCTVVPAGRRERATMSATPRASSTRLPGSGTVGGATLLTVARMTSVMSATAAL